MSAVYDTTVSTLAAEYSYGPYPHQADASQGYYSLYPSEYNADSTWNASEQRKLSPKFWRFVSSVALNSNKNSQILIKPLDLRHFKCLTTLTHAFLLAPPRPATPEKFTVPHRCARFGPGGHLIQVLPNLPSDGQPALVDIHSMEVHFDCGSPLYSGCFLFVCLLYCHFTFQGNYMVYLEHLICLFYSLHDNRCSY